MQTTATKKDYRQEIARFKRRLQTYRCIYMQEAERTLEEWMSETSNVTKSKDGYYDVHLASQVERRVDAQFPDLKGARNPYSHTVPPILSRIYTDFWHSQIEPINDHIDEQVRAHWHTVWRAERVDFRALPPVPPCRYLPGPQRFTTVSKKDNEYQFGQITVLIDGEKKYRYIVFCVNGIHLWAKNAFDITIKDCLTLALPIAQRLDRVCDWSTVNALPDPALNALHLRMTLIQSYYTREYDRRQGRMVPGYEYLRTLRKFALYGEEEELQAILQAEKDRHAPRR